MFSERPDKTSVQLTFEFAKVNNVAGRFGVQAPTGTGYKITAY